MYLANKTYGELRWGLTATPKYDITKDAMEYISTEPGEGGGLSDTLVPDFRMNDSFRLRQSGFDNAEGLVDRLVRRELIARDEIVEGVVEGRPRAIHPRSVQRRTYQKMG